jgi:hypothetical protein
MWTSIGLAADRARLWMRAEHAAIVLLSSALVAMHARDVNWARFVAAFASIDLVGYLPGAIAFRRARAGRIAPIYYHLYNVTHSYLTAGLGLGVWALAGGGAELAMLAVPIHLSGDRGLLGNFYKPISQPFETTIVVAAPAGAADRSGKESR